MNRAPGRSPQVINHERAFRDFPVGLAVGQNRVIAACNQELLRTFRCVQGSLVGQTFEALYPDKQHYERTGERVGGVLARQDTYTDDRVMRRLDGELFWVHVRGFTYTPGDPHRETLWVFTELATRQPAKQSIRSSMTPRERDIATLLIEAKTGKEVARTLGISPRTVDVYKTRLLRKFSVTNTRDLVQRMLTG